MTLLFYFLDRSLSKISLTLLEVILEILKEISNEDLRSLSKDHFSMILSPIIETIDFSILFCFLSVKFFKILIISSRTPKPCPLHTQLPVAPDGHFMDITLNILQNLK